MMLFQNPFVRASWQDGVLEAGQATIFFPIRYISYQYGVDRPPCFACQIAKRKARPMMAGLSCINATQTDP